MTPANEHPNQLTASQWRLLWVAIAALLQFEFLLWVSHSAVSQALQCEVCDTGYYYGAAVEIVKSGLLFANTYEGYRSYFVPLFIAAIQQSAAGTGYETGAIGSYAYGISFLFCLISTGLMWWLSKRTNLFTLLLTSGATLLNPFLIVYLPYALQESALMFFCLPLLFIWVGAKNLALPKRAALVLVMALLAYMIRSSLVWWLLPAVLYAGWLLWPQRWQFRNWLPTMSAVAFIGVLIVGPQIYISKQKSASFNPYPSTTLLSTQIAWGIDLLKYGTVEDEGHWRGLTHFSPFVAVPNEEKTIRFYLDNPARAAFLMVSHAYAGFHYDQLKPYWQLEEAGPLTIWLLLSSAIVFLGVTRMADIVVAGKLNAEIAFGIATLALCVASLLFVAAESRFGIIGFAMLSIQVAEWLTTRPVSAQWGRRVAGLLMYVTLSILFNIMLWQSADLKF